AIRGRNRGHWRHVTMLRSSLLLPLGVAACGDNPAPDADAGGIPNDRLEMDVPPTSDDLAYEFGRIAGMALLPDGRVAVADGMANEVRVFDENGTHQFTFGRRGAGPGEFDGLCCLAIDRSGRLWVRDG